MIKKTVIALFILAVGIPCQVFAAGKKKSADPTVMAVGGQDVKLSEFEYLYKKNNTQQSAAVSLDDYINMFVDYKLKVRAAQDAGLDTTANYLNDMQRYRSELAAPYLVDKAMRDSLINEAYAHRCEVVTVRHIILPAERRALADSLHAAALAGADFEQMVRSYSADPAVPTTGGLLSFTGALYPYQFEDAAFTTAVGKFSPVFQTPYGLHFMKVESRRADPGEVRVRHILKQIQGGDSAQAKAQIDSIHTLLMSGADFADMACRETMDPSGRSNGGQLPWFGVGRMIPEFEAAAYALADGQISEPVLTSAGYHILLREALRPTPPIDSVRPLLERILDGDYRSGLVVRRTLERYGRTAGVKINRKALASVAKAINKHGGLTDACRAEIAAVKAPLFSLGKESVGAADVLSSLGSCDNRSAAEIIELFNNSADEMMLSRLRAHFLATLADREPAYRNLLNEYSDGMLLYEISNREVWDRANTDAEGLEAYFKAHRDNYRWNVPHYRGYLVSAVNDTIADDAVAYLGTLNVADNQLPTELRKKFGTNVRIDRVIAGRGSNPIVDNIAFGGEVPEPNSRWKAWRGWHGAVVEQPEYATDVRGAVSIDYQQQLEKEWLGQLHDKYPVTVWRERLAPLTAND